MDVYEAFALDWCFELVVWVLWVGMPSWCSQSAESAQAPTSMAFSQIFLLIHHLCTHTAFPTDSPPTHTLLTCWARLSLLSVELNSVLRFCRAHLYGTDSGLGCKHKPYWPVRDTHLRWFQVACIQAVHTTGGRQELGSVFICFWPEIESSHYVKYTFSVRPGKIKFCFFSAPMPLGGSI